MPQFAPSSVHKATANFSNPKSAGFDYSASFCMGADWTVMASTSFHLNAGESKPIAFSVTMPSAAGTYPVYLAVFVAGVLIATFKATEDVVIAGAIVAQYVSAVRCIPDVRYTAGGAYMTHRVEVDVKNISGFAGSLNFTKLEEVSGLAGYPGMWFGSGGSKTQWLLPIDVGMAGISGPYVVNLNPGQTVTVAFAALVGTAFDQLRGTFISEAGTIVGTFTVGHITY